MADNSTTPDKERAAVCGLFCPSCTIYIATHEDPLRLKALAERMGLPESELECDGCRSQRLNIFCRKRCKMKACASEKGIEFCGECGEYPCKELIDYQSQMPHRKELWNSLERINEAGWETWYSEMEALYSCKCGTINSAYDFKCRKCGVEPSCKYVGSYGDDVQKYLSGELNV